MDSLLKTTDGSELAKTGVLLINTFSQAQVVEGVVKQNDVFTQRNEKWSNWQK